MTLNSIAPHAKAIISKITISDISAEQNISKLGIIVGREIQLIRQGIFRKNAVFLVNNRLINIPTEYQQFIFVKQK